MPDVKNKDRERALIATGEELAGLLHHPSADVLLALAGRIRRWTRRMSVLLLERKDLRESYSKTWRAAQSAPEKLSRKAGVGVHPRHATAGQPASATRPLFDGLGADYPFFREFPRS